MTGYHYKLFVACLAILGVLFSGYLSAVKLFSQTCALREPCPYFLGYPACWYGFGMFLTLLIVTIINLKRTTRGLILTQTIVAGLGTLFATYFTIPEIEKLLAGNNWYTLGLPTCAYGLIFYVIILYISIRQIKYIKI